MEQIDESTRQRTIAVAESCPGGLLSSEFVNIPGASKWFKSGIVAYTKEVKVKFLGVDPELAEGTNCVDPEIAKQMAKGVSKAFDSEIGIGVTGYADPWNDLETQKYYTQHIYYSIYDSESDIYYTYLHKPTVVLPRNEYRQFIAKLIFEKVSSITGTVSPKTIFVSGHRCLTPEEFNEHYSIPLKIANDNKSLFVMGDACGADQMAFIFLISQGCDPSRIKVYIADDSTWDNSSARMYGCAVTRAPEDTCNFRTYHDRDNHLTNISDEDLLWVRPSGTFDNYNRRLALQK